MPHCCPPPGRETRRHPGGCQYRFAGYQPNTAVLVVDMLNAVGTRGRGPTAIGELSPSQTAALGSLTLVIIGVILIYSGIRAL